MEEHSNDHYSYYGQGDQQASGPGHKQQHYEAGYGTSTPSSYNSYDPADLGQVYPSNKMPPASYAVDNTGSTLAGGYDSYERYGQAPSHLGSEGSQGNYRAYDQFSGEGNYSGSKGGYGRGRGRGGYFSGGDSHTKSGYNVDSPRTESSNPEIEVQVDTIYVSNLSESVTEEKLNEWFRSIGVIKTDKRTGKPKIWIYYDKTTNLPKGDATITYDDPHAADSAIDWFDGKEFLGQVISVKKAERKAWSGYSGRRDGRSGFRGGDRGKGGYVASRSGGSGGGGPAPREGDWTCESCGANNFAKRFECYKCNTLRPAGSSASQTGGYREGYGAPRSGTFGGYRGREGYESGRGGRGDHGGYDSGRSTYDSGRGGYGGRGSGRGNYGRDEEDDYGSKHEGGGKDYSRGSGDRRERRDRPY